jgi:uncharacterized protein YegL
MRQTSFLAGRFSNLLGFSMDAPGTITGSATAQLNPAYLALLLDVSGSMMCPSNANTDCNCRLLGNCPGERIQDLVEGVKVFREHFNPKRDVIGVIAFNLAAKVIFPMTTGTPGAPTPFGSTAARLSDFEDVVGVAKLQSLVRSNTNICDALLEAIRQFQTIANSAQFAGRDSRYISPSVVLFSDGAPNAFRGIFLSPGARPGPRPPPVWDAYQYSLEWYDSPYTYRGPGPIVDRVVNASGPTLFGHTITAGSVAPTGSGVWGPITSEPRYFQSVLDSTQTPPSGQVQGAITNLNFRLPYTLGSRTGAVDITGVPFSDAQSNYIDPNWTNISPAVTAPVNYQNFEQLPYYCSIAAADFIRTEFAGSVYVLGLGPGSSRCGDPLQDADDHLGRKDYFLERLANSTNAQISDTQWASTHNFSGDRRPIDVKASGCADPDGTGPRLAHRFINVGSPPVYVGYKSSAPNTPKDLSPPHPESTNKPLDTRGEYLPTQDAKELKGLFGTIAKQILLRLTGGNGQ